MSFVNDKSINKIQRPSSREINILAQSRKAMIDRQPTKSITSEQSYFVLLLCTHIQLVEMYESSFPAFQKITKMDMGTDPSDSTIFASTFLLRRIQSSGLLLVCLIMPFQ